MEGGFSVVFVLVGAAVLFFVVIIFVPMFLRAKNLDKAFEAFKFVACGIYSDTREYHGALFSCEKTIIYFADGRKCELDGEYTVNFPPGTPIRILQHPNGDYRIVKDV